jgi:hypothetical protein
MVNDIIKIVSFLIFGLVPYIIGFIVGIIKVAFIGGIKDSRNILE